MTSPRISRLSSCSIPARHFRVHPHNDIVILAVSPSGSSSQVENGGPQTNLRNEDVESYRNIARSRTSFSNLSKRFRNKNKIGMGGLESQSQSHLASSGSDDTNNNLLGNPPLLRSRSTISCRSRLRDPSIFSSRGTLCDSSENVIREHESFTSNTYPPVLKSCLKKSSDPIDKFLCGSGCDGSGEDNNTGQNVNFYRRAASGSCSGLSGSSQFGFRRFITVATLIYICFVICIPSVLGIHGGYAGENKEDFIQSIWKGLTKDEISSIFGRQNAESDFNSVPNFDIIQPKMVHHRKARGRRSLDYSSLDHNSKLIQIQGLGRQFDIRIKPNQKLLDPHFVFLKRNDNYSEIMPESHVQQQLPCFYHGVVQHFPLDEFDIRTKVEGPVALSLCGGLKGFILPSSIQVDNTNPNTNNGGSEQTVNENDSNSAHHYVIHPIPTRFHQTIKKREQINSTGRKDEDDDQNNLHEQHHFLFRLSSDATSFPNKHAKSLQSQFSTNNLDDETITVPNEGNFACGHNHHPRHDYYPDKKGRDHFLKRKPRSASPFPDNGGFSGGGSSRDHFDSYWFHQYQQPLFSPPSLGSSAVFPSSYWGHKSNERFGSPFSPGITGAGNIGLSFARRNYYEVEDDRDRDTGASSYPSSESKRWSTPSSKGRGDGVLVYESTASSEDEPDTILPFYTKGRKKSRHGKIVKSNWIPTSGEGQFQQRSSQNYSSNSWSNKYNRKGRRDENYFGTDYKSPLDSEDKDMNNIFMEKKGHYDAPDSNSIYSRETTTINQNRDENRSQDQKPPAQLTIETAVFVDKDLFRHMQSNFPEDTHGEVVRIVLAMINAVQLLYQDPSLGHRVDFVLKRLEVLETDPPGLLRPYDIDRFLTNFCKWQKTENPVSDSDPLHWDHALILTGLDLYVVHQSGKISNQVVGLAPVAGMCTRSSSCTVNEGRHFESVFVISHEIGHNLGMRHDGPQADNDCDPTSHIMSPTLGSGKIAWSPCSRKYLEMFLETSQSKCLLDKTNSEVGLDHDADGRLPGERFDSDRQCVLKYGRGSFHATQQPLEDVCRDLHCRREHYTWTSHPALEGTYCGTDMWCRSGKCVRKSSHNTYPAPPNDDYVNSDLIGSNHLPGGEVAAYSVQKAVDGVWGEWSLFTDCSSACLHSEDGSLTQGSTGVRLAARRCDSPRPENGGRQCSGPDRRYKTCPSSKVSKICSSNTGRTRISQYANDVCKRAATVDNDLTGVGFMMSTNDVERACSVWCETENGVPRSRGWSFGDGTTCSLASQTKSRKICVAGKCQEFTCNPYSYYALSDEECSFSASNEVTPQSSWYTSSSLDTETEGKFPSPSLTRNGKSGWTDWESHSECKLACLAPAKGLELVKRRCSSQKDVGCTGLALSVKLCKPDKSTILRNGCSRLQTPLEFATKVCSKYAEKIQGLSGIGMQLSPTKEDSDRPCRIGCQDVSIPYRFYMVNGEDGWFPAGTDCSRGEADKKAFCVTGKCVDFGVDDTPVYRVNNKLMGRIETLFNQRSKRQATYNIMEPLKVPAAMDESSLRDLVHKFSQQTGNFPSISAAVRRHSNPVPLDFTRPIVLAQNNYLDYSSSSFRNSYPSSISGSGYLQSHSAQVPDSRFNSRSNEDERYKSEDKYSHQRQAYRSSETPTGRGESGRGHDSVARGRSLNLEKVDLDEFVPVNGKSISSSDYDENNLSYEGSYYEWRKIVSDCSVSCGKGIQEVIVECVSGDTVVSDRLCASRPRPGHSGYVDCLKTSCTSARRSESSGGHIWNWLQSVLPKNSSNPVE